MLEGAERDELRRLSLNQQDNATNQMRLRAEFDAFLKAIEPFVANVAQFLMHPEKGAIARIAAFEAWRTLNQAWKVEVENHITQARMEAAHLKPLEARVNAIEDQRSDEATERKEKKRWAMRDLLAPTLASLFAALVAALLTAWILAAQA